MPKCSAYQYIFSDKTTGLVKTKIIEEIPSPPLHYLVFEGGGVRGRAYGGVIQELEQAKMIASLQHTAGSSIGSIAALLVALGYSAKEVNQKLDNVYFSHYLEGDKPWSFTPNFLVKGRQYLTILTAEGNSLSSGSLLTKWLEDIIEEKLGPGLRQATFADLVKYIEATGGPSKFKYLSIVVANLSKGKTEIFNHETAPDLPIALAVRMSLAFPGVFKAIEWYNGDSVNLYADGGIANNLPANFFNKEKYLPEGYGFTETGANPAVLCIKVDTAEEMEQIFWNRGEPKSIKGLKEYSKAVLACMQSRNTELYDQFSTNCIQVFDHGIGTLKFDLTERERKILINSGREATLQWLQTHVAEAYKIKTYDSEEEWLTDKTMEAIKQIQDGYKQMLETEAKKTLGNQDFMLMLEDKINWFDGYLNYRFQQLLNPHSNIKYFFTPHIDLKSKSPREECDTTLINDMENKLLRIETEIKFLEAKIDRQGKRLDKNEHRLHNPITFDQIVYLSKLQEKFKLLKCAQRDLCNKLNKSYFSQGLKAEAAKAYTAFHSHVKTQILKKQTALPHYKLLTLVNEHFMKCSAVFRSEDGILINLDLKNPEDLQDYMMACYLYMKYINGGGELLKAIDIFYKSLFSEGEVPKKMFDLGAQLGKEKLALMLSAYRIETMMKNFIALDKPKEKSSMLDIDFVLDTLASSNFIKRTLRKIETAFKEEKDDYEMEFIYDSFAYEQSDKFLLFQRLDPEKTSSIEDTTVKKSLKADKLPKCLRRL